MSTSRRRVDWSFGPGHGPVSGVLNASTAALGITMWAWLFHVSSIWALVAGVGLTAAAVGVAIWYDQAGKVVVYRAVSWLLTGLWSWWALVDFHGWYLLGRWHLLGFWSSPVSPWSMRAFVPLLVGTLVTMFVGWRMDVSERREVADVERLVAARLARQVEAKEADRFEREPMNINEEIGDRWQPFLRRITRSDMTIMAVELWEPFTGFTLDCQLPDDGSTVSDVKQYEEALAAAAPEYAEQDRNTGKMVYQGLPEGCGVEIMPNPGLARRNILIKVTVTSALGQDIPYPLDQLVADNIENPVAIGVETDRKVARIPMRFETTVMVGNTDSGKSNETNVITAGLGKCTNVLLVGIDLSGHGKFFRPWNRAHYEGKAANPMFSNVAITQERARALCQSLLQIIDGRTADYSTLMRQQNKDYLPVSPEVPLICLVIDEFKRLASDVQDMVADIVETGRGSAVRVFACSVEATRQGLPGPVLKHARNRIGMRVTDENELVYLFDAYRQRFRFDPASMPWRGSGYYSNGPGAPRKFKGYRIDPEQVSDISIRLSSLRPQLDDKSLARGNTVTVTERTLSGPEEVTYDGVWTTWQEQTYPDMFAEESTGSGTTSSAQAGGTTMTRKGSDMGIMPPNNPEALAAQGMAELGQATDHMNNMLAELQAAADGRAPIDTPRDDETGDSEQADEGGEDGSRPRPRHAGPPLPTDAELAALLEHVAEPVRPRDQGPAGDPLAVGIAAPGEGVALGGPAPKRRMLQLIYLAGAAGIRPGDLHKVLAAEGYPTSLTTVQNQLKEWFARKILTQEAARQPYYRGEEFPTDRL